MDKVELSDHFEGTGNRQQEKINSTLLPMVSIWNGCKCYDAGFFQ